MIDLPPPDQGSMTPTFIETFERFEPGEGPWTTRFKWDGIGAFTLPDNGERQLYVDPSFKGDAEAPLGLDPFEVEDGRLVIEARPTPEALKEKLWGYPYISGMISTYPAFAQTYGHFEIRARIPEGQGLWTAFWLMPVEPVWPPEIDILEVLGDAPDRLYVNLHTTIDDHAGDIIALDGPDLSAGFHDFAVAWRPETITWSLDGEPLATRPTPDDMHEPMHLLITLAVGGHWPGEPDATTPFPARLVIDHVRIHQFDDLKATEGAGDGPRAP